MTKVERPTSTDISWFRYGPMYGTEGEGELREEEGEEEGGVGRKEVGRIKHSYNPTIPRYTHLFCLFL